MLILQINPSFHTLGGAAVMASSDSIELSIQTYGIKCVIPSHNVFTYFTLPVSTIETSPVILSSTYAQKDFLKMLVI